MPSQRKPAMDLIDRYLHATRFWLPEAQRDDILAELADDLRSQVADREASLNRALTEDELAAFLKERGQPMTVASQFQPESHLISPQLMPGYWFVLKLVVLWILLPVFAVIVAPLAIAKGASAGPAVLRTAWNYLSAAFFAAGVVTAVFAIVTRMPGATADWDPRQLPDAPPSRTKQSENPVSPSSAIAEMVMAVILAAVWLSLPSGWLLTLIFDAQIRVGTTPAGNAFYWLMVPALLSGLPIGWTTLVWPARTGLRAVIRLAANLYGLIPAIVVLSAGPLIELTSSTLSAHVLHSVSRSVGFSIGLSAAIVAAIVLLDSAVTIWRLMRNRRPPVVPRLA